jgi:dUTP diphosphatase
VKIELHILDAQLPGWGFPSWGSSLAAGLDLHAAIDEPLVLEPQAPAVLISTGFAIRIADPEWCALILPRSGLGHRRGLVLGNAVGVVDADYQGPCLISAWNRNPPSSGPTITIAPGDRIAQLIFTRIARPEFSMVSQFSETAGRNAGGFGSTGVEAACPQRRLRRHSADQKP